MKHIGSNGLLAKGSLAGLAILVLGAPAATAQSPDMPKFNAFLTQPGPETLFAYLEGGWEDVDKLGKPKKFGGRDCVEGHKVEADFLAKVPERFHGKGFFGLPALSGGLVFFKQGEDEVLVAGAISSSDDPQIGPPRVQGTETGLSMQLPGNAITYDFEFRGENMFSLSFEANAFGSGKTSYYFRRCPAK